MRPSRASIVLLLGLWYYGSVFQLWGGAFWSAGIGDWMDPYFINYLLEHWYHALRTLSDPSSPPMFHPARHTLGYSHGMILYVPLYVPARLVMHPFQAHNMTLLVVILMGVCSLYVVFRRFMGLSFLESLLLTAFFAASPNVTNGEAGVWSQRLSVFLVPPILLVWLLAWRASSPRRRAALAFCAGLLSTLLLTHDFSSAQFTFLFAGIAVAVWIAPRLPPMADRWRTWWMDWTWGARLMLLTALVSGSWALYVALSGGATIDVLGLRLRSHDWRRPALVALTSGAGFAWWRGMAGWPRLFAPRSLALASAALGGVAGVALFLWIYLPAYREFPGFPPAAYREHLVAQEPDAWRNPLDFLRHSRGYDSSRPFVLALVLTMLTWIPSFRVDRRTRAIALLVALVSLAVFLVPYRFGERSIWGVLFDPLPGFNAIRDPRRIIYQYELALALAVGLVLARLGRGSIVRTLSLLVVLVLMIGEPNRVVFTFDRPNYQFDQWVEAPIDIDPQCTSFFTIAGPQEYDARSWEHWTRYSMDAMFISVKHGIPTLHGYSAWTPSGWNVWHPHDDRFREGLKTWITRHNLRGVCQLDLEERTIRVSLISSQ